MDPVSATIRSVFRELSRLCDGDHTVYLRTDPQTFVEFHRGGAPNIFTSTIAALMPNVVIKLQTPLVPPIISAVPSQQGRRVLHSPSRLFVIEHLSDILDLVKHQQAAFIREDATLAVWAVDVQTALTNLQRVQKEMEAQQAKYDTAFAVDPTPFYGDGLPDNSLDFDSFIHDFDPTTPVSEKPQDLSSVYFPIARNTLPPLGTLDGVNSIDSLYPLRSQMFDSLSSVQSNESPMLSDSPSTFMASMAQLHINNTPNASPSIAYSTLHTPYAFSSPSSSAGSTSDSVLSTPMTIAPSVLSSPQSWGSTPLMDSPALFSEYDEQFQGAHYDSPPSSMSLAPAAEIITGSPAKRKRSFNSLSESGLVPEHAHIRRFSRPIIGGKTPASPSPRPRKTSGKSPLSFGSPASSERALCPLPGRSVSSRRSSDASSSSTALLSPPRSVSQPIAPLPTFDEELEQEQEQGNEHQDEESSADEHSEYEADRSSDDEYLDEEFRPSKRSRTVSASGQPLSNTSPSSSSAAAVRRKVTPPKIAAATKVAAPKKKGNKKWGSSTKRRKASSPVPSKGKPQCPWCDQYFTREGDVERHEKKSCKYFPFEQERDQCPDCGKDVSRHDAMLRHLGSDDCMKRQKENAELAVRRAQAVAKVHGH